MTGVVRPDSIPVKAACVKSEESGSIPSFSSHASPAATRRIRPKVRTSAKRRRRPPRRCSTTCVLGDSASPLVATTSRPVMRRLITSDRLDASSSTAYFPRRRTPSIRSPVSAPANSTPDGASVTLASRISTRSIVLPAILRASPRTIVSTSGSSGTRSIRRRNAAQVELDALLDAV